MRLFIGIVLTLSLIWPSGHRRPADSDPAIIAAVPSIRIEAEVLADVAVSPNPFAYVREDGSLEYVTETGEGTYLEPPSQAGLEDLHAGSGFLEPMNIEIAVYSWSSPAPD